MESRFGGGEDTPNAFFIVQMASKVTTTGRRQIDGMKSSLCYHFGPSIYRGDLSCVLRIDDVTYQFYVGYAVPKSNEASLIGTVMPWGIYQYRVLPMGICNAPDIFQSIMMRLLGDLQYAQVYMDDILIASKGSYSDHMAKLKEILKRLENAGFRANLRKCFFATDRVEYLGYEISREGIHPQPKKK